MPIIAEDFIPGIFLPQLRALRDAIFERVLPAFEGIESEAEKIEREVFQQLCANANEYSDESHLAELAFNAGLEHYEQMTATRQTVINTFTITISHLFEQQRHLLSFDTLLDRERNSRQRDRRFSEFLESRGVDCTKFIHRAKLEELDLVANVAKHAEGQSAERLRALRPELFVAPSIRDDPFLDSPTVTPVNRPLMGEDLFVQPDDLRAYLEAIESFWQFVLNPGGEKPDSVS
jgi:hypothetical protein